MVQRIHFSQIKCFSEEIIKDCDRAHVLKFLKEIVKQNKEILKTMVEQNQDNNETSISFPNIDENIDEMVIEKFLIKDVTTNYLVLNLNEKLNTFLDRNESQLILHKGSKYYFVNQEFWQVLSKEILNGFSEINKNPSSSHSSDNSALAEDVYDLANDFQTIEKYYNEKKLVVDII